MILQYKADGERRSEEFISSIKNNDDIYFYIEHDTDQLVPSSSNEYTDSTGTPILVIPVWSTKYKAYSKYSIHEQDRDKVTLNKLKAEDFLVRIVKPLSKENVALGLNWNQHLIGSEYLIEEFINIILD